MTTRKHCYLCCLRLWFSVASCFTTTINNNYNESAKSFKVFLLLLPITSFYITDTSCPGQSITLQYFLPRHLTAYQTIVNHSYPLFGSGFRQYVWCLAKRDNAVFEHLFIWFANTIPLPYVPTCITNINIKLGS